MTRGGLRFFCRSVHRRFKTLLWGNSVALSWMWGLGLFFSIQITVLHGLPGLLVFAIPNAAGLICFGWRLHRLAQNRGGGSEALALYFERTPPACRWVLQLYQLIALALTVFAAVRYGWMAMSADGATPAPVYVGAVVFAIVMAGALLGEFTGISRIKFTHGLFTLGLLGCALVLASKLGATGPAVIPAAAEGVPGRQGMPLSAYVIPLVIGLLAGPWLDLQQWQRAVQMQREGVSVRAGFAVGGVVFFLLLLFRGQVCEWVVNREGAALVVERGRDGFYYAHDLVTRHLSGAGGAAGWAELLFVGLCALTTLDSGYIALRWFQEKSPAKNESLLSVVLPQSLVTSPLPIFLVAGLMAWAGIALGWELEYFMAAYASFFVGYATLAWMNRQPAKQERQLLVAGFSLAVFATGYFGRYPWLMALGAALPLVHAVVARRRPEAEIPAEVPVTPVAERPPAPGVVQAPAPAVAAQGAVHGRFDDKTFVYSLVATYADTNSVGNVYFAMYSLYVGKARELFFNALMPDFDLKTTSFLILTRDYQHRFLSEAREFDTITVRIRITGHNRKFCTLAHEIHGRDGVLLGDGSQRLLFVSSINYELLDIPAGVRAAFIRHV